MREAFLAEIKEALSNGMALHWPSDDECRALAAKKRARSTRGDEQRVARQRERTAKDAAVIVKQANRMAAQLLRKRTESVTTAMRPTDARRPKAPTKAAHRAKASPWQRARGKAPASAILPTTPVPRLNLNGPRQKWIVVKILVTIYCSLLGVHLVHQPFTC